MHAAHAQAERVRFGDVARAQERGHHRDFGPFDHLQKLAADARQLDAVPRQNKRPLSLVDQVSGLLNL